MTLEQFKQSILQIRPWSILYCDPQNPDGVDSYQIWESIADAEDGYYTKSRYEIDSVTDGEYWEESGWLVLGMPKARAIQIANDLGCSVPPLTSDDATLEIIRQDELRLNPTYTVVHVPISISDDDDEAQSIHLVYVKPVVQEPFTPLVEKLRAHEALASVGS